MVQPKPAEGPVNFYLEQLWAEVSSAGENTSPSRATLKKWAEILQAAFTLDFVNVIHNQAKLLAIAYALYKASIRLPIATQNYPEAVTKPVLEGVGAKNAPAAALIANIRFAMHVMTQGFDDALVQYAGDFLSPTIITIDWKASLPGFQQSPWIDGLNKDTAIRIANQASFDDYGSAQDTEIILIRTIRALNFDNRNNFETQQLIATHIVVPWMREAIARGFHSAALNLESFLFSNFVRLRETEQHYQDVHRLWAPMTEQAGRALRTQWGAPKPVINPNEKPVVGFFVHRASMLAHIQVLHTTLKGIGNVADLPYRLIVYVWSDYDVEMDKAFTQLGVSLVWLKDLYPLNVPYVDRMLGLRQRMEQDGVQVLVWMCVMHMKGLALGLGLAPRQIYWNAKFQVGAYDTPDERITWHDHGDAISEVDGRQWRSVPIVFPSQQSTLDSEKLSELRQQFSKWKTILGTMAREDILNHPPFLNTVARILKQNPDAVYFYTGRENLPSIQAIFKDHGVQDQTVFVGWVNTVLYANLVDVYLDSWPARSGMTGFNTFEAGKAFVSFLAKDAGAINTQFQSMIMTRDDQNALHFSVKPIDQLFDTIDDGKRFFTIAENEDDYIKITQRLIDDKTLRQKTGDAFGKLGIYLADATRAGKRLDLILRENLEKSL